jgi:ribonuclease P protein component
VITLPVTRKKIKINFNIAIKNGAKFNVRGISIYVKNKNTKSSNLGVIISKKVSNLAVVRNKYRRYIKEIFRLDFQSVEYKDLVFILNKRILDLDFNRIRKELSDFREQIVDEKLNSNSINLGD